MAITIKGVRIDAVTLERDTDGEIKVSGSYALLSSDDRVLAKQGINGYNNVKVEWSRETLAALSNFVARVKEDVNATLGLTEG